MVTGRALYSIGVAFWNDLSPVYLVMSEELATGRCKSWGFQKLLNVDYHLLYYSSYSNCYFLFFIILQPLINIGNFYALFCIEMFGFCISYVFKCNLNLHLPQYKN